MLKERLLGSLISMGERVGSDLNLINFVGDGFNFVSKVNKVNKVDALDVLNIKTTTC
jgi:hypothetical protein